MYVIEDRLTPSLMAFTNSLKTKNIFLKYFPTTTEGTTVVFHKLFYYLDGVVQESAAHKKIYNLLNVKVDDLKAEDYTGIERCFIYLKRVNTTYTIPPDGIEDYIDLHLPLTVDTDDDEVDDASEWIQTPLVYNPASLDIATTLTNAELTAKVRNGSPDIWFSATEDHPITAIALLDTTDLLFEKNITITERTIKTKILKQDTFDVGYTENTSKYIDSVHFTMSFRRIKEVTNPTVAPFLSSIEARIISINNLSAEPTKLALVDNYLMDTTLVEQISHTSINEQLELLYNDIVPPVETSILSPLGAIKYDGMAALTGPDFSKVLGKMVATGFDKKKASFMARALSIVLMIIILVIAWYSGGQAMAGLKGVAALMAFSATAAVVLTVGMFMQMALAMYFRATGDSAGAMYVSGTMQILGTISTIFSIIGIYGAWKTELAKAMVREGVKKATISTIVSALKSMVIGGIKQSTSNMMQAGIRMMSAGMSLYREYIDPLPKQLDDMQAQIAEQEKELEDYSSPDNLRKSFMFLDDKHANMYDMNEYMQNIPWLMTEGKNRALMQKYYS